MGRAAQELNYTQHWIRTWKGSQWEGVGGLLVVHWKWAGWVVLLLDKFKSSQKTVKCTLTVPVPFMAKWHFSKLIVLFWDQNRAERLMSEAGLQDTAQSLSTQNEGRSRPSDDDDQLGCIGSVQRLWSPGGCEGRNWNSSSSSWSPTNIGRWKLICSAPMIQLGHKLCCRVQIKIPPQKPPAFACRSNTHVWWRLCAAINGQ